MELQKGKKIKVVNSDKGDEYYGRYDETGRNPGSLARYLQDCGIDARYKMSGTPEQNGIWDRRNHAFLDTMRCMLIHSSLLEFMCSEALRIVTSILNEVLSKFVRKTPHDLQSDKKPSLHHFCVWSCKAEVRP